MNILFLIYNEYKLIIRIEWVFYEIYEIWEGGCGFYLVDYVYKIFFVMLFNLNK